MASTAISCVVTQDEGRGGGTVIPGWEKCEAGRGGGGWGGGGGGDSEEYTVKPGHEESNVQTITL